MSKRFTPNDTPNTDIATRPHNTRARVRSEVSSQRTPYARVRATVRDKNGNIVNAVEQNVDSLVQNFWKIMYGIHAGTAGNVSLPSLSGGNVSMQLRSRNSDGALESYAGIVVGSGSTAVAYNQSTMATLITHGVGTGQLSAEETSNYYDPVNDTVEIVRTFVNADTNAADITVRECGICNGSGTSVTTSQANLYCRDVLDTPLVVPFEGVLTVVYTITFFNGNANYTRLFNRNAYRARTEVSTSFTNVVNTTGVGLNFVSDKAFNLLGVVGATTNGIVLGTGNTNPTTKNTWAMESPIAHGEAAGQLFYYESTISSQEEDTTNGTTRWYLNRVVQNRSGSTITFNEVGLFCNVELSATGNYLHFMVDRKLPDEGGVAITNSAFATISWEICYEL